MVSLVNIAAADVKIDFMPPYGQRKTFDWRQRGDLICFCEKHYSKDINSY